MARKPALTLETLAEAALGAFIAGGFEKTQMADIAERLGVAQGTLYRYVESKEALLYLVAMRLMERPLKDEPTPVRARPVKEIAAAMREEIARRARWPRLTEALASDKAPSRPRLEAIGSELFALMAPARHAIWLVDRLALEDERFNALHQQLLRGRLLDDLTRLTQRLHDSEDAPIMALAARNALEVVAWNAMHRHREDPRLKPAESATAEAAEALTGRLFAAILKAAR